MHFANFRRRTALHTTPPLATLAALFLACSRDDAVRPDPSQAAVGSQNQAGQGGTAGSGGAAGSGGSAPCPTDLPGPMLVELKTPAGVSYCMDRTEVTQSQYALFLEAATQNPDLKNKVEGQRPRCLNYPFNLIELGPFNGEDGGSHCPGTLFRPEETPDSPVVCVGDCAARAYCQWAGKQLCGNVRGGALDVEDIADPNVSAFTNACTNGGTTKTATGEQDDGGKCTLSPVGSDPALASVEAEPACHGASPPFDAVLNLGGNVMEWEDACPPSGGCKARGATRLEDPSDPAKQVQNSDCVPRWWCTGRRLPVLSTHRGWTVTLLSRPGGETSWPHRTARPARHRSASGSQRRPRGVPCVFLCDHR
jgi:formylglycine-generating enzyme